jgi:hypothetical protein
VSQLENSISSAGLEDLVLLQVGKEIEDVCAHNLETHFEVSADFVGDLGLIKPALRQAEDS